MTDKAREERNAYHREYYRKNKNKVKQYQSTYWEKKALKESAQGSEEIRS